MNPEPLSAVLSRSCDVRLLRALRQHWYSSRRQKYLTVPRADHGLILLLQGSMDYLWDGGSLCVRPGDLILLSKGSHYDVRMYTEQTSVQTLLINFDVPETVPPSPPRLLCANAAARFEPLMRNVVESGKASESCLQKAHFYYLLADLQKLLTRHADPEGELLECATRLLSRDEPLPMEEIARQCCISESSLRRLFHRRLNTSPAKYRSAARLRQAAALLVSTDLPVEAVAAAAKYYDAAYFCRCFWDHYQMTPTQYRQNHRPMP